MANDNGELGKWFGTKKFDVENGLAIHAYSFYTIPAEEIYNEQLERMLGEGVKDCHIYLIGYIPKIDLIGARQETSSLIVDFDVQGEKRLVEIPIPAGYSLQHDGDLWFLTDGSQQRYGPTEEQLLAGLRYKYGPLPFHVVYVGQAYGNNGSRHALDRLKKHETLQKIALKGAPDGFKIQTLLIETQPDTRLMTFYNPHAQDSSRSEERIAQGLDKLFDTNEHELITLYEASLIRYFQPKFNKEFKNSFPSTNLKVLADCYEKDFSSVVAEFCFDDPPFLLGSDVIADAAHHFAHFDLHEENDRKVFFATE